MEGDEASTTSSAAGTPPASEVSDAASGGDVRSLRETIEKQSWLINDMLAAQMSMKQEVADARTAQRAAEIRSQFELSPTSPANPGSSSSPENEAVLKTMLDRLPGEP